MIPAAQLGVGGWGERRVGVDNKDNNETEKANQGACRDHRKKLQELEG